MPDFTEATEIARVVGPSMEHFERDYVRASRPVVLTGLVDHARLRETLSLARMRQEHAEARVPVAHVRGSALAVDPRLGLTHELTPLGEFLDALREGTSDGYLMARSEELPPTLRHAFEVPRYCVGAPWRVSKLWIASRETVAVLHRDLADNLHTLLDGGKRFTLVSPAQNACVYPHGLLSGLPNGARVDLERPDYDRFPRARGLRTHLAQLAPGETLFIPHGWWHQVRTTAESVSINTWWARGRRVPLVAAADWFKRVRGLSR